MDDDDETENDRETRHDLARVDRMTTGRPWPIACLLLLLLLLAGCQPVAPSTPCVVGAVASAAGGASAPRCPEELASQAPPTAGTPAVPLLGAAAP